MAETIQTESIPFPVSTDSEASPGHKRRLRPLTMLLIMLLPLAIILTLGLALIETNRTSLPRGITPDFSLITYDGQPFKLSEQQGSVVLINFWASWCSPCRVEAPDLNALWAEYKDRGLIIIGVGYLDNEGDARAFLKEFNVQYPTGHDNGTTIAKAYRITGVPETFLIDKEGKLDTAFRGPVTAEELRPILDRLLSQNP